MAFHLSSSSGHRLSGVGLSLDFLSWTPLCYIFHKRCNACLHMASPNWPPSILDPAGRNSSSCGYCGPPGQRSVEKTSTTTGVFPHQLSCNVRTFKHLFNPPYLTAPCPRYTRRWQIEAGGEAGRIAINLISCGAVVPSILFGMLVFLNQPG